MARKSTRSAKESKGVAASKSKKRRSNSNANSVAASISTTTIGSFCESSSSASRSTFLEVMRRQRNSFQTFFVIYSTSDEPVPDHVMEHFSQETIFHFNDANDIQENSKFVMCSSSLELVEALRNRSSYVLAMANTGSTFVATCFLENLSFISGVGKFIKKAHKEGKVHTTRAQQLAKKSQKTKNLTSLQNFTYKLAALKDKMRQVKLKKKAGKYDNAFTRKPTIKITLHYELKGTTETVSLERTKTLGSVVPVEYSQVATYWPARSYSKSKPVKDLGIYDKQILYVR